MIVELLINMTAASYFTDTSLAAINALLISSISLEYGNTHGSAWGYINVGTIYTAFSKMDEAYRFGELSLRLNEKYKVTDQRCKVLSMFGFYISHWKKHISESRSILEESYKVGIETGDVIYASYSQFHDSLIGFQAGDNLKELDEKIQNRLIEFTHIKFYDGILELKSIRYAIHKLQGIKNEFDSDEFLKSLKSSEMPLVYHIFLIMSLYTKVVVEGDFEGAYSVSEQCITLSSVSGGMLHLVEQLFLQSITIIELIRRGERKDYEQRQKKLTSNRKQMNIWAENCPENFRHKYLLIEAECSDLEDKEIQAIQYFEEAKESALENNFMNYAAFISELAAKFHNRRGRKSYSRFLFGEAKGYWEAIGATGKVSELIKYTYNKSKVSNSLSDTSSTVSATLDLQVIIKSTQAISSEIQLGNILERMITIVIENAGAQRGVLLLERDGNFYVEADGKAGDNIEILKSISVEEGNLPTNILNYVVRTTQSLVIPDGLKDNRFNKDTYITINKIRSILCMPIFKQGKINGILYLENNLITNAFTTDRLELLRMLSAQASISIENAKLYNNLEQKVEERTKELQVALEVVHDQKIQVESTLEELKVTQDQLVEAEKFAALGQLVAGVAHEINNPIGAVQASAERIQAELEIGTKEFPEYFRNLKENEVHIFTELLDHALTNKVVLTTKEERNRKKIIKQSLESLDFSSSENRSLALDYLSNLGITDGLEHYFNSLKEDSFLKTIYIVDRFVTQDKSLRNIYISVEKASKVVFSMRKFLNANIKTEMKTISIREEIEKVIKVYDNYINGFIAVSFEANSDVSLICHTEEMTQVWRNIIFNAIQAMYSTEKYLKISILSDQDSDISGKKMVTIKFQDTGMGMTPEIKEKIYTPFFTTKPAGEGIGLGLFISRKIVEEHGGEISFTSEVGNTEFVVRLPT